MALYQLSFQLKLDFEIPTQLGAVQPAKQPYLAVERLWVHEPLRLHRPLPQDLRIGVQPRLLFRIDSALHHRS